MEIPRTPPQRDLSFLQLVYSDFFFLHGGCKYNIIIKITKFLKSQFEIITILIGFSLIVC